MKSLVVAVACCLISSAAVAGEIPGSAFSHDAWSGAGFTNENTGKATHCIVSKEYRDGHSLLFSLDDDAHFTVGIGHEAWILTRPSYDVALVVDDFEPLEGTASVPESSMFVTFDDAGKAMAVFHAGKELSVMSEGARIGGMGLAGADVALDKLSACAERYIDRKR